MESFHWDKHFETGLETVDCQHRALVDLINRFGELVTGVDSVPFEELEEVFVELTSYTQYHFQEEENMMSQVGLDPHYVNLHKQLHADFLQEVITTHEVVLERPDTAGRLLKLLTYWLAFHILGTDQSMARQVAAIQTGQTPESAYLAEKDIKDGATEPLLVSLNGLFKQVSERNRELLELNRTLEARVEERTHALSEANQLLEELAMTDLLTGLPNRRQAMTQLSQAWNVSMQDSSPLACMMIDADGFKQINDNYGHDAGDEVLKQLSKELSYAVRTDDIVCRLGGDEFLIICPNTALDGALIAANKIREKVANLRVSVNGGVWVGSISVGIAVKIAAMQNLEDLIKAADASLYIAKRNGRNRVESNTTA